MHLSVGTKAVFNFVFNVSVYSFFFWWDFLLFYCFVNYFITKKYLQGTENSFTKGLAFI